MTHCLRCGRVLQKETETGYGPVCLKKMKESREIEITYGWFNDGEN